MDSRDWKVKFWIISASKSDISCAILENHFVKLNYRDIK
jgi:hypothetical protein